MQQQNIRQLHATTKLTISTQHQVIRKQSTQKDHTLTTCDITTTNPAHLQLPRHSDHTHDTHPVRLVDTPVLQ